MSHSASQAKEQDNLYQKFEEAAINSVIELESALFQDSRYSLNDSAAPLTHAEN